MNVAGKGVRKIAQVVEEVNPGKPKAIAATPEGVMLDGAEVVETEANPLAEVAKLQEGAAVEGRAAAQGVQAAEDAEALAAKAEDAAKRLQEAERIPAAVEKPKPVTEGVPGEPVQERMPVVEEKPQPAVEQGPAHEVPAEAAAEARAIEVQEVLDYNAQYKTQICDKAQRLKVEFLEDKLPHILADRPGHLPDTPASRQLLLDVASDPRNYFTCSDARGSIWCEKILEDGSQVWVQIYNGYIRNAGLNIKPRKWDPVTGLARNIKKIN